MKKMNVLQLYAAAVCFFSAVAATISGGGGLYDIVQMSAPEIGIDGQAYQAHQNNRDFVRWYGPRHRHGDGYLTPAVRNKLKEHGVDHLFPDVSGMPQLENEEEITKLRNESFAAMLAAKRHNAARDFVREVIILLLALALFWFHWRLLKKMREE